MRRPLCVICMCYVVAVMALSWLFPPSFSSDAIVPDDGSRLTVCGTVSQIQIKQDRSVVYITSDAGKVICYFPDNSFASTLKIGNVIRAEGTVRLFESATNPGQFDAKEYYGIMGYDFAMSGCSGTVAEQTVSLYRQGLYAIKRKVEAVYDVGLPETYAGIMKAMVLGEKTDMDPDIKNLYQENGIGHILAISALHITFLGKSFFALLKRLRLPEWLCSVLAMLLVISFGVMTGSSASTIRSVIMFSLFLIAGAIGRTYDMITAMAVSAVVLLVINPRYIYHSGFLLSFGAVMGIALVPPFCSKRAKSFHMIIAKSIKEKLYQRFQKYLYNMVASLCTNRNVVLFTLPIQLYFFFTFSPYSILLNLIVVPLMGVVMVAGVMGGIVGCVFPFLARILLLPCHLILWLYEKLCLVVRSLPGSRLTLGQPAIWQIICYYILLFGWLFLKNHEEKIRRWYQKQKRTYLSTLFTFRGSMLIMPLLAIVLLCLRFRTCTTCTMLDIGQGDCFIIQEASGCNIMVDGGSSDVVSVGKYRIIPYLQSQGISHLDYLFVSHADTDHISGIMEMLKDESQSVDISCLALTKFACVDEEYTELVTAAEAAGVRILYVAAGDVIRVGQTTWTCLYPRMSHEAEGNDQSMVLLMECGLRESELSEYGYATSNISILFMGDLTEAKEACFYVPDVNILKVGHHGSRYSTTEEFLSQCKPELALISAGRDSIYGHPHDEVLKRLKNSGSHVVVTAESGAVCVRLEEGMVVRTVH